MKAMLSKIKKKNLQGTNSEGKEDRVQINNLEHKEEINSQPAQNEETKNKWGEMEDGSEVGGSRAQFSLFPAGTPSRSSEEQNEQPMESQLIWSLEAKNCRGHKKKKTDDNVIVLGR